MAYSIPTSSEDVRQKEEHHFLRLKNFVLDYVITQKHVSEYDITFATMEVVKSFKSFSFHEIDLSKWSYACAYFHLYGAQGAGLTRFKMLDALQNCEDLVLKFQQPNLNVISLGGSAGNDIAGLMSALQEMRFRSYLDVTILDSVKEWYPFGKAFHAFIKRFDFGNSSKYFHKNKVRLAFMNKKLSSNSSYQFLKENDVILIIRLISSCPPDQWNDMTESIFVNMKRGALAIVIDAPYIEEHWTEFETLYLSQAGEEYRYEVPNPEPRFAHSDCSSTKAQIAILRKA